MPRSTAGYLALAAVDTALAATGRQRGRLLTKPLLMPALAVGRDRPTKTALALSGAGDVALLAPGQTAFTAGLGSFLAAHVAWIRTLRERPGGGRVEARPALALPYGMAWLALNGFLWPRTGRDRWPVLVYSAVLAAMAVAALDTDDTPTAVGGALFMTSDSLLALERFADVHLPAHEGLVMATYTAAQLLLASGGTAD